MAHGGLLPLHIPHVTRLRLKSEVRHLTSTSPGRRRTAHGAQGLCYSVWSVAAYLRLPGSDCSNGTSPLWLLCTMTPCAPSCTGRECWLPHPDQAGVGCCSPPPPAAPAAAPPAARAGRRPAGKPAAAAAGAQVHPSGWLRCRCSGDCTRSPRGAVGLCQTQGTGAATAGPAAVRQCAVQGPEPAAQRAPASEHVETKAHICNKPVLCLHRPAQHGFVGELASRQGLGNPELYQVLRLTMMACLFLAACDAAGSLKLAPEDSSVAQEGRPA